ncbi:hypothetical protein [Pseudaquabacterium rugosum]|uniref:Uncharacterized protein n=1 Tax=Pseudaquabacterium rugosum TaxID=2984194 RepID=A0ABU9B8L0_9BURK
MTESPALPLAAAAGLASAALAAAGLTWPQLLFAACGAFIGAGGTRQRGPLRAVGAFAATVVLAAKAGGAGAAYLVHAGGLTGEPLAQALAAAIGLFFHPLASACAARIQAGAPAGHTDTEAAR